MKTTCPRCQQPLKRASKGRRRRYCSPACRQASYRRRRKRSVHFSSATCEWETPADRFAELDREFSFTLDACATAQNAKCPHYFTRTEDGLRQRWTGRVFCNPPYGRTIGLWVKKAWESVHSGDAEVVVCLVPARTDTGWFQDYAAQGEVTFLRGRIRFGDAAFGAPFPSAIVVFRNASARYETTLFTPSEREGNRG